MMSFFRHLDRRACSRFRARRVSDRSAASFGFEPAAALALGFDSFSLGSGSDAAGARPVGIAAGDRARPEFCARARARATRGARMRPGGAAGAPPFRTPRARR